MGPAIYVLKYGYWEESALLQEHKNTTVLAIIIEKETIIHGL